MKFLMQATIAAVWLGSAAAGAQTRPVRDNPAIDMPGFLRASIEAAEARESRRISEEDFIRMSREPGTIVLDARSHDRFDELHVKGAMNLSFSDIAVDSLHAAIPDKATRILIYCNNNFIGNTSAFASKLPAASLNLSTYVALFTYGYRNVYELAPLVDLKTSQLQFESSRR